MIKSNASFNEAKRATILNSLQLLDTPREERFDRLARLAQRVFTVPIVIVSLVDQERQWFKACLGLDLNEIPRELSFCEYNIKQEEPLVITDTLLDPVFENNPYVVGEPYVRFYAGQTLFYEGLAIGSVCVIDQRPREFSSEDRTSLLDIAMLLQNEFGNDQFRAALYARQQAENELYRSEQQYRTLAENLPDAIARADREGRYVYVNPAFERTTHRPGHLFIGKNAAEIDALESALAPWSLSIKTVVETGKPHSYELEYRPNNSEALRYYHVSSVPEFGPDGQVEYVLGVSRDITESKLTEAKLRESEQLFTILFKNAPVSLSLLRLSDDVYLEANDQYLKLYGYSRDEVIGHSGHELGYDLISERSRFIEEINKRGKISNWEYTTQTKTGKTIVGIINAEKLLYRGEACALITFVDLTERLRVELELHESQARFASLFQVAPVSLTLIRLSDGVYVEVNDTLLKNSGYRREDIIGRNSTELGWSSPRQLEQIGQILREQGYIFNLEFEISRVNGERREGYINASLINYNGELCLISSFFDATELRRMERELRRSQERLQTLVDNLPVTLFTIDPQGLITSAEGNGLEDTILAPALAEGCNVLEILKDRPEVVQWLQQLLTGYPANGMLNLNNVFLEIHALPTYDTRGQIIGACWVGVNVTERVRTEEELHDKEEKLLQSQKMEAIGRLAGGVAHDFNNLLTAILGCAELLLLDMAGAADPQHYDLAQEIKSAAEQAGALTRQLLAFSRKQLLQPKILDLNSVIVGTVKLLYRLIGDRIEIVSRLDPQLGLIKADPNQLEQILINLAVNARDAMQPKGGGQLLIETGNVVLDEASFDSEFKVVPGSYVMLSVSDTGIGMNAQTLSRIFEPFFTTREIGHGTGLGLSTVYGIIQQSGGYILPYSQPGVGTSFKIYLPKLDKVEEAPARVVAKFTSPLDGWETILLVEDEDKVRDLIRKILVKHGYKVLEARNAMEALAISQNHNSPIELLLTDVIMPEITGPELAQRLKTSRSDTKVLFISGYSEQTNFDKQGWELKSNHNFLEKPFKTEALLRKLRQILEGNE